MHFLTYIWIDLLATALGLVAVNSALNGVIRTSGRGGGSSVIYRFRSTTARVLCAMAGLAVLAWVVIDLRHKFPR